MGDSIALAVRDLATGQRVFCAPGLSQIGETELAWMREADCLLLDNLLPGPRNGHSGPGVTGAAAPPAWLDLLRQLSARHKVLFGDAPNEADGAGWADMGLALAYDGMEIEL